MHIKITMLQFGGDVHPRDGGGPNDGSCVPNYSGRRRVRVCTTHKSEWGEDYFLAHYIM